MTSDLHADAAVLTSHVLDTARGRPGRDVQVDLLWLDASGATPLVSAVTNQDGRCEKPLLTSATAQPGRYRLDFHVGSYFSAGNVGAPDHPVDGGRCFFDVVPVEFSLTDPSGHYHVPLVASPWGYSTYRGAPPAHPPDDNASVLPLRESVRSNAEIPVVPEGSEAGDGGLTTHVIDVAQGCGAAGLEIDVFRLGDGGGDSSYLGRQIATDEGRTENWLVPAGCLAEGWYELVFQLGAYFAASPVPTPGTPFFEIARVRFCVHDRRAHHHVPLLASPWGYTTYRGS